MSGMKAYVLNDSRNESQEIRAYCLTSIHDNLTNGSEEHLADQISLIRERIANEIK